MRLLLLQLSALKVCAERPRRREPWDLSTSFLAVPPQPIPGSQTWASSGADHCGARKAYPCGDLQHCCCMFGCSYDIEKDNCTSCSASDPLVAKQHIPSSHLWSERKQGICNAEHSHTCGAACCCNAGYSWEMKTRLCTATADLQKVSAHPKQRSVSTETLVPGSQTWIEAGHTCESRNAYHCNDGKHCCCRFGCDFDAELDTCSACRDSSRDVELYHIPSSHLWAERIKEGTCTVENSHVCGKSCCCNGLYRWDLETRKCVKD